MVNLSDYTVRALVIWAGSFMTSAQSRVVQIRDSIAPAMAPNYTLPPLGYAYDALEPYFDKATMEIHHSKHHQTYVNNLNNLLANVDSSIFTLAVDDLVIKLGEIKDQIPEANRTGVRNNAGGHSNHSFFWKQLKVNTTLGGELEAAIIKDFGNVTEFKTQFEAAATKVFGSGWAFLIVKDGKLKIVSTPNQDSPLMSTDYVPAATQGTPVIALDVWEHAYYLKYQNRRPDYIKAYWNVVNWDFAAQRYSEIVNSTKC